MTDDYNRQFPITWLCREDLEKFYPKKIIEKLDDGDMTNIASKMTQTYMEELFWIDLEVMADIILEDKKEKESNKKQKDDKK